MVWRRNKSRGRSRFGNVHRHAPSRPSSNTPVETSVECPKVVLDVAQSGRVDDDLELENLGSEAPQSVDKGKEVVVHEAHVLDKPIGE